MPQLRNQKAMTTLAANVRKHRIAKDLTQEKLANLAGVETSQISRLERRRLNTSVSVIFAIAEALGLKPGDLLDE